MAIVELRANSKMKIGFGCADITPIGLCDLNGFSARQQPALGVGRPVQARVLVVTRGRISVVVAACDLLGFTVGDSAAIEARLAQAAHTARRHVLLCCTHTHSAPMSMPLGLVGRYRRGYVRFVTQQLVRATRLALADRSPVEHAVLGAQPGAPLGDFRCGLEDPDRAQFTGQFHVLQINRRDAPPVIVGHLGVHPYVMGPGYRCIHPDYPGATCDLVEAQTGARAIMLPGCGADVAPRNGWSTSLANMASWAGKAAALMREALAHAQSIELEPLSVRLICPRVRFGFVVRREPPTNDPQSERYEPNAYQWCRALAHGSLPRTSPFPIRLLRMGSLLLIGMPAELFHDTGADLAGALPRAKVLTLSHAGGNIGYLPRPFAYRQRTYEAASAYEWYGTAGSVAEGTEATMRQTAVATARRLLKRPRSSGREA